MLRAKTLAMAYRGIPGSKIGAVAIVNPNGAGNEELYQNILHKVEINRREFLSKCQDIQASYIDAKSP